MTILLTSLTWSKVATDVGTHMNTRVTSDSSHFNRALAMVTTAGSSPDLSAVTGGGVYVETPNVITTNHLRLLSLTWKGSGQAQTYTVSFDSQGGSSVAPITNVVSGSTITKPADPTRANYTFGGWYKEAACTNAWNFITDTVTGSITLYAKWTQAPTGTNLIVNGNFEKPITSDGQTWNTFGGTGFTKDIQTHAGLSGNCLHLTATSFSGTQLTKADSSYKAIEYNFIPGKTYTVKFKAVADAASKVQVIIQTPSYSWKANKTYDITTSVQQFSDLTYSPSANEQLNLVFNFTNSPANANIYLDDIELIEQ